jgi:hypothetical protein
MRKTRTFQNLYLEKHATLHLSDEDSRKLLLLASSLENSDTSKKMSDSKLQKHLFDSAKQLKLKELKLECVDASSSRSTINW